MRVLILIFFIAISGFIFSMEKETKPEFEFWHELPVELKKVEIFTKYLQNYIANLVKAGLYFNELKARMLDLRLTSKSTNALINNIISDDFIINLAGYVNARSEYPISYYQLAKSLMTEQQFKEFQMKHKIEADLVAQQIEDLILKYVEVWPRPHELLNELKDLIKKGANLDYADLSFHHGWSVLQVAVYYSIVEIINLLIKGGANINFKSINGETALDIARDREDHQLDISDDLGDWPMIIEMISDAMEKPLKERIFNIVKESITGLEGKELNDFVANQKKQLEELIIKIRTIDIKDNNGNNPLYYAILKENFALAIWLLSKDLKLIKEKNKDGITPLEIGFGLWGNNSLGFLNFVDEARNAGYINYDDIILTREKVREEFEAGEKEFLKEFEKFKA